VPLGVLAALSLSKSGGVALWAPLGRLAPTFALCMLLALSALWGNPLAATFNRETVEVIVAGAFVLMVPFVFRTNDDLRCLAEGLLLAAAIMLIGAVAGTSVDGELRWAAFGGGPNVFARIMFFGLASAVFLAQRRSRGPLSLLVLAFLVAGLVVGMILAQSRAALLVAAPAALVLIVGLLMRGHHERGGQGRSWAIAAITIFTVAVTVIQFPPEAFSRLTLLLSGPGTSGQKRLDLAFQALDLWRQQPYFGAGLGSFATLSGDQYPHNWLLELAVKTGLAGLSLGVLAVVSAVVCLLRSRCSSGEKAYLGALLVFSFGAAQFSGDFYGNLPLLVLLGLCANSDGLREPRVDGRP
jgi:hypothetical protein